MNGASALNLGSLIIYLTANATEYERVMKHVEASNKVTFETLAKTAKYAGVAVAGSMIALGTMAVNAAAEFESAFAGVKKTVTATTAEFSNLEKQVRSMAMNIPVDANELSKIMEGAGALGIKNENLVNFTRTMADMGVATDIASTEAGDALAKLANITGMSQKNFDRLSSSIVILGNNLATGGERNIVNMAMRLAGAGSTVKMTEAQIIGLSGALASLGIEAEAGGTAMSQTMIKMAKAAAQGGAELAVFASVSNQTTEEFQKAFGENASQSIVQFLGGLGRIKKEGGNVFSVFESLGIEGARIVDMINRTSGAENLLTNALALANKGWNENVALTNEADKRYATMQSQFKMLKNTLNDMLITIGGKLLPALSALLGLFRDSSEATGNYKKETENLGTALTKTLLTVVGLCADVVAGWKLVQLMGEFGFGMLIKAAVALAATVGGLIENIVDSSTQAFNLVVKAYNATVGKVTGKAIAPAEFKKLEWVKTLEGASDDATRALMSTNNQINELVEKGKPSEQLFKEYEKGIKKAADAAHKADEDLKKGALGVTKTVGDAADAASTKLAVMRVQFRQLADMPIPESLKDLMGFGELVRDKNSDFAGASQFELSKTNPFIAPIKGMKSQTTGIAGADDLIGNQNQSKLLEKSFFDQHDVLEKAYQIGKQKAIDNNDDLFALEQDFQDKELQMIQEYTRQRELLESQKSMMLISSAQMTADSLTQIAQAGFGEQSGVYKAMFAASKAFAIAQSIMSIQTGVAKAIELGWPLMIPAIAQVTAAAANIVSSIQGVALSFEGGGMTPRGLPRSGGVDGRGGFLAVMHGDEEVIDHRRGGGRRRRSGDGGVSITQNFMPGTSRADLAASTQRARREAVTDMMDIMSRGGAKRKAFKR